MEKNIIEKEEAAKIQGYTTDVIDSDFRNRLTTLLDKVRVL